MHKILRISSVSNLRRNVAVFAVMALFPMCQECLAAGYSDLIKSGEAAYAQGDKAKAEKDLNEAVKQAEKAGPKGELYVAEALNDLGVIYDEDRRFSESEAAYNRALAIREKHLGPKDLAVAVTLNNMANLYKDQNKLDKVEAMYKRTIEIGLATEGPNSDFIAMSYWNLAHLYIKQKRYEEAISPLKQSAQICEKSTQSGERLMDIVGLCGDTCEKAGKTSDAKAQFLRYYELAAKTLRMSPNDPKTSTILKEFAADMRKQSNTKIADYVEKAIAYHAKKS